MKRPIEKFLLILNSLIGLAFVVSVAISSIPIFKLDILDKYLKVSYLKGVVLYLAMFLAVVYLGLSVLLIINRMRFTNNSIYVYGVGEKNVTSGKIKRIVKSVCKKIQGIKSVNVDIQLGEFGNCLLLKTQIIEGYDFQAIVGKLRPMVEEAITENLGIKFPSYKFADENVLYEFGAPYSGIGIDLKLTEVEKPVEVPAPISAEPIKITEKEENKEITTAMQIETQENIKPQTETSFEESINDIDFEEANQYIESLDKAEAEMPKPFIKSPQPIQRNPNYEVQRPVQGTQFERAVRENPKPSQQTGTSYNDANWETQKPSSTFDRGSDTQPYSGYENSNREQRVGQRPAPRPAIQQNPMTPNMARPRPNISPNTAANIAPNSPNYNQRPMGQQPAPRPQSRPTQGGINYPPNIQTQGKPPSQQGVANPYQQPRRPASTTQGQPPVSKEDVYARINAILNKYSKTDGNDDNK